MLKKIFSQRKYLLAFWFIFLVSIFIKFYQLGSIPKTLNRDEASLGYTAYSILKTGRDERGNAWPINIQSFGDWKLPGYVYTLIPFIAVFGLEDWVVRLPSALSGVSIGILSFFLVRFLITDKKNKDLGMVSALITFFIVTISPWSIHFSHVAYEAHLAMLFFMAGFIFFFLGLNHLKNRSELKMIWLEHVFFPLSTLFFGLTLFTYHSYQVFTPLMGLFLIISNRKAVLFKKKNPSIIISALIATIFILILLFAGTQNANKTKFGGLSIFNTNSYELSQAEERSFFEDSNSIWAKLFSNKIIHPLLKLEFNIEKLYSPEFFFLNGGANQAHNISGVGNFLPIMLVFMIIGLINFYQERESWQELVFAWLVFASVAPIITFEANHTTRFSPGFVPLSIIIAYGAYKLFSTKKITKYIKFFISFWFLFGLYHFMILYFIVSPQKDVDGWAWEYREIAILSNVMKDEYDEIYLQGESSSPYIFLLYYLKIDPLIAQQTIEYYPPTAEGFVHAKKMGKYNFQKLDWNEQDKLKKRALYIIRPQDIPIDRLNNPKYHKEFSIDNKYSKYNYDFWSYDPQI